MSSASNATYHPATWSGPLTGSSTYPAFARIYGPSTARWAGPLSTLEPHIPVFDKSERQDGTFSRSEFTYDRNADVYTCAAGKLLRQRQKAYRDSRPLVDDD